MNHSINRSRTPGSRIRIREQRTILLVGDLFVSFLALFGGLYFWGQKDAWLQFSLDFLQQRVELWYYFLPFAWILLLVELYDTHKARDLRKTTAGIALSTLGALIVYSLIYLISPQNSLPRLGIGIFLAFAAILTFFWRIIYIQIFTSQAFLQRVLVVGAGEAGETVAKVYNSLRPQPFFLVGFLDDNPEKVGKKLLGFPILAGNKHLLEIIEKEGITEVINAISGEMRGSTFQAILDAQEKGVDILPMPTLYEELLGRVPIRHLESDWLIRSFVDQSRSSGIYEAAKRIMDIFAGLVGMAIYLLLFPLIAIITLLDSGAPVLYKQTRLGKGGKPFNVFKFNAPGC